MILVSVAVLGSAMAQPLYTNVLLKRDDTSVSKAKSVLEWIFAITALCALFLTCCSRCLHLRSRGRSMNNFFDFMAAPTPRSSANPRIYVRSPTMSPVTALPRAYFPARIQTRARDTDEGGRRDGRRDPDDGDFNDKDVLPAYDNIGSPPTYPDYRVGTARHINVRARPFAEDEGRAPNTRPPSYAGTTLSSPPDASHLPPRHPDL